MSQGSQTPRPAAAKNRLEWETPAIQKMDAGDAEGALILGGEIVVLLS